ncbi:MAG TPA: 2-polyprenyl-3-methyl-6-methoxy-1,4-benzoquinone monooxygenase [Gammaproteobacteria bacterium]|nr:2-polyprenyl-3-methyl-6-methoxy-1,4-benzoquinone monooxygenase [Gammaproteobacteria bacterium]
MLKLSFLDKSILHIDNVLRGFNKTCASPAEHITNQPQLSADEKRASRSMMRINHSGEICAQALYHSQALLAKSPTQYATFMQAAEEENAHLSWCKARLTELNGRPSILNPVWYAGSFAIGLVAGAAGDQISLGFLAETEYQVTEHLEKHLANLPHADYKSRAVLHQMRQDELQHATKAKEDGGSVLPAPVKFLMRCTAKVLTVTARWI